MTSPNEKIVVKDIDESLDFILSYHSSVARFGDGEMDIIAGKSIPYQHYDERLANELRHILSLTSTPEFLVCVSDVFDNLERYNDHCKQFWNGHKQEFLNLYQEVCTAPWYGSTFISRPYMDLKDKSHSSHYFAKLKQLWDNQDLLIVEGETSRSGVGNDLFSNARSIQRIICPSMHAFSKYDAIYDAIIRYGKDKLILMMLGPTAKVLSYHLHQKGYRTIDIGHIDSEYEWFKMGATSKVKLAHKHTAEHNFDENLSFYEDDSYSKSIIWHIDTPLISVIVPVYNVKEYLSSCIESILNQSYHNIEIILINDGSTDGSAELCFEYALKDKRIKVVHQNNSGLSAARNKGIELSNGEYIFFIDSDDKMTDTCIEHLYVRLKSYDADVAISRYYTFNYDTSVFGFLSSDNFEDIVEILSPQMCMDYSAQSVPYIGSTLVTAWGKLYKKSLFNNVRFPVGKLYEDGLTTHKLLLKSNKVILDGRLNYQYTVRHNSIMTTTYEKEKLLQKVRDSLLGHQVRVMDTVFSNLDVSRLKFWIVMNLYSLKNELIEQNLTSSYEYYNVEQLIELYENYHVTDRKG